MNYPKIVGLLYLVFSGTFLILSVSYSLSGLTKDKILDFDKRRGLYPFVLLTTWFLLLGLLSFYNEDIAGFLRRHKVVLTLLFIFSVVWAGLYLFSFKRKLPVIYSLVEIIYGCAALVMTVFPKSLVFKDLSFTEVSYLLLPTMGYLYVMVRGLENIDRHVCAKSRLFAPWNIVKAYILRFEN